MGEQASTAASTSPGGETVVHGYRSGYRPGVRGGRVYEHGRERQASETAERIGPGLLGKGQRQGANRSVGRACAERARAKARLRKAVGRARAAARQREAASRVA